MYYLLCVCLLPAVLGQSKSAVVTLSPTKSANAQGISGKIWFNETDNGVILVTGEIYGLKAGKHGFHVHETGNITDDCLATGAHFNPENKNHGAPSDVDRHVGDLGNIESDGKVAKVNIRDSVISLSGNHSILGRGLVVHADADDLGLGTEPDSKTTGHAGERLACGKIAEPNNSAVFKPSVLVFVIALFAVLK